MLEHLAGKIGRALITYAERHQNRVELLPTMSDAWIQETLERVAVRKKFHAERHNHKDAEILHEAELVIETYKIVKDW